MSNIYIQEPPTQGKVLLHTSVGDIDIELWSKEAPKACRNFIQLCLEGYYNGTVFHRIIRGFIVQGGDPTGTGEGGESIYGNTFKDEFHSRLKFVRRGLVAMANAGPNDNGSQFFFTLDKCDHLNGKHTIFGKVTGQTIYNVLKFTDIEVDGDDRPVYPPKIKSTEVLSNPFDDIIPRITKAKEAIAEKKGKSKSKATKNFSLLSFGEEAEEEEADAETAAADLRSKSKSAHDLSHDPTLLPDVAEDLDEKPSDLKDDPQEKTSDEDLKKIISGKLKKEKDDGDTDDKSIRIKELKKESDQLIKELKGGKRKQTDDSKEEKPEKIDISDFKKDDGDTDDKSIRIKELKKESDQLIKELKGGKRKQTDDSKEEKPEKIDISDFKEEKKQFQKRKKLSKGNSREEQTLAMLAKFQNRLVQAGSKHGEEEEEEKVEEVKDPKDEDDEDVKGDDWLAHKLHFDTRSSLVKDANIIDADTYDIIDPRNPINKRKRESSKQKGKNNR